MRGVEWGESWQRLSEGKEIEALERTKESGSLLKSKRE